MTGRERLMALIHGHPVDRLAWTALVDKHTLVGVPEDVRGNGGIDFYRHLGCDILLLNGWGTPHVFRSPELVWGDDVEETVEERHGEQVRRWRTPKATLTGTARHGHPVKYPVDSIETLRAFRAMWEGARYVEHDDGPVLAALDALIGDDGLVTRFWGPSTIPRLLEEDMGTQNFYYLLHDYAEEMLDLIAAIHERQLDAFKILSRGPCDVVILCENTSTYYISPDIYRRFNGPHVKDFVDIMRGAGKRAIIHMCGHIVDILPDVKKTGLDGVHALTPPPTGNTPWELVLDVLGDHTFIVGALDPTILCNEPLRSISRRLGELYTPRLRRANFVLCAFADGIEVPYERFMVLSQWMKHHGQLA